MLKRILQPTSYPSKPSQNGVCGVYILVTYDVKEERVRRRLRALLRRYSFAMLAYSVYIGRGNRGVAERLAARISRLLGPGDRAALLLLQDFQYELLVDIRSGRASVVGEIYSVRVFYGAGGEEKSHNDASRRPGSLRAESQDTR